MTDTRTKIEEANFFLTKLGESEDKHPAFDYYLSAFVSAARSVPWIMRHEYCNVAGWKAWYDKLTLSAQQDNILKTFNSTRVRAQKKSPLRTNAMFTLKIPREVMTRELEQRIEKLAGKKIRLEVLTENEARHHHPTTVTDRSFTFTASLGKWWRVLEEFSEENILVVCKAYYELLDSIVTECESKFSV